jgi:hypothetical protein
LCGPNLNNTTLSKYLPGSCRDTTVHTPPSGGAFLTF